MKLFIPLICTSFISLIKIPSYFPKEKNLIVQLSNPIPNKFLLNMHNFFAKFIPLFIFIFTLILFFIANDSLFHVKAYFDSGPIVAK